MVPTLELRIALEEWHRRIPDDELAAERRQLLHKLADLPDWNGAESARHGTLDNGTPISVAGGFVLQWSEWTRYYAG